MNDTTCPKRLYRVKSHYANNAPTVYYVVASGSTAAESAVLEYEDSGEQGIYFVTEQVAEQRFGEHSPVPHALLFGRPKRLRPEELIVKLEKEKELLTVQIAMIRDMAQARAAARVAAPATPTPDELATLTPDERTAAMNALAGLIRWG